MVPTELERDVIALLLKDPALPLRADIDFSEINVVSREFTGAGFLTTVKPSENLKLFEHRTTLRWGLALG